MKLYFSRNYNPRLALAVARYLGAPVSYEFASPFDPAQSDRFRKLNPNLSIPILEEDDGSSLWEADAIACRLSQLVGSEFWRTGAELPDMIRWISWGYWNFMRGSDVVHFERVTKQRYRMGPVDDAKVADGLDEFRRSALKLQTHLSGQDWLLASGVSYADFRMACVLPYADLAGLPLRDYPKVQAWHDRLMTLPYWADPFDGLFAPELPAI